MDILITGIGLGMLISIGIEMFAEWIHDRNRPTKEEVGQMYREVWGEYFNDAEHKRK